MIAKLISKEKGGFIPCKETSEGALIVHKIVHLVQQVKSKAMILKLCI